MTSLRGLLAEIVGRVDETDGECAFTLGCPPAADGWRVLGDLLADAEGFDALVESLVDGEADGHRDVAGSYLASWLAGPLAQVVVTAWRRDGRVLHLDADHVSVRFHEDGWIDGVAIDDAALTVGAEDVAAGVAGVGVVVDADERLRLTVDKIRALAEPIFAAVRARVPYGRSGMWGSLADGLAGGALFAEQSRPDGGDPERAWTDIDSLLDALAAEVPELRARPRRQLIPWSRGTRHQPVRGTCCLYYKTCAEPDPSGDGYCSSCPHRPDESRAQRITRWLEGDRVR